MDCEMSSLQQTKNALRKEITKRLSQLSGEEKQIQTNEVLEKLFHLEAFKKSERISVYLSTENEINTEKIVKKIFELNKKCYVPRYNKQVMEMVRLYDMKDWENLPLTKWNIKQPSLSEQRENPKDEGGLDLIILPGVAFSLDGKRLGHGKGYYDTFQTNLFKEQSNRPTTIAVAFKEQVLDSIPTTEHDVNVDIVLYSN